MALAREALTIVLREQRGCLQSFETDEIMRLMAADRLCRLMYAEADRIWQERDLDDHDTVCRESIDPLFSRIALKLLVLAPDYIAVEHQGSGRIVPPSWLPLTP